MSETWKDTADRIAEIPVGKWPAFVGFVMAEIAMDGEVTADEVDGWFALMARRGLLESRQQR